MAYENVAKLRKKTGLHSQIKIGRQLLKVGRPQTPSITKYQFITLDRLFLSFDETDEHPAHGLSRPGNDIRPAIGIEPLLPCTKGKGVISRSGNDGVKTSACDKQAGHFTQKAFKGQPGRVTGLGSGGIGRKEILSKERRIGHYVVELLIRPIVRHVDTDNINPVRPRRGGNILGGLHRCGRIDFHTDNVRPSPLGHHQGYQP